MREIKTCSLQEWEQLPTEELDQILQAELEKEYPDEEVVLPILRILEERERDYPVEQTPEVLAMIGKLSEHETSSKKSKNRRGWIAGIATLAAVICIVIMALPQTVGAESIFDVLIRWTSSVFEFIDPDESEKYPDTEEVFATDHPGLKQVYDKVTELGVTESVVPMWLPEGFELLSMKTIPLRDGGCKVNVAFRHEGEFVSLGYRISQDITTKFEKDESIIEVFDAGGISHFVLKNGENLSATWTIDGVECSIISNIAKEDIYKIIKSIYRRPLE